MKIARKIATALRIIGWILVAIAVSVTIYALATSGGPWSTMSGSMKNLGVQQNFFDRMAFDRQFYNAMIDAANTKNMQESLRIEGVRSSLSNWEEKFIEAEQKVIDQDMEEKYRILETMTPEEAMTFLERYRQMESGEETRLLKEAIEYLDSVAAPTAGKGKLAKLKPASVEPEIKAAYEAFSAEHGDAAGEYLEYVETVVAMVKEDIASGTAVTDVKVYVKNLDPDRYFASLAAVQAEERQQTNDIREEYAALMETVAAGGQADLRGYFENLYAELIKKYPNEPAPDKDVFLINAYNLLWDESFDGSVSSLMTEVRAANNAARETRASGWMTQVYKELIRISDQNNDLGIFKALWFLAANIVWVWVIGILLIVAATVVDKTVSSVTMARLEKAGIEEDPDILLRVNHLKQYFRSGTYINKAVDDVSFYIKKGEVFGLVGESGCGKTTTGRTIINLYDPTEGDVYFEGLRISSSLNGLPVLKRSLRNNCKAETEKLKNAMSEEIRQHPEQAQTIKEKYGALISQSKAEMKKHISEAETKAIESYVEKSKCTQLYRERRQKELTEAYQKDMASLTGAEAEARTRKYETELKVARKDNVMTRMQMIFQDPIASINPRMTVREIIAEGLRIRGIKDKSYIDEKVYEVLDLVGLVREHADRYPHEFSGGQRQRIGIARAIVLQPDLIIADEPISALDVSIQAQVINLLNDLRNRMGLTIMFIAHNLSVVKYFSDRIGVMYYGHLVELADSDELFRHPLHPYTKSLLSAIPYPDPHHEKYRKRIEYDPHKAHDYSKEQPVLREIRPGHFIRCNQAEYDAYLKELNV